MKETAATNYSNLAEDRKSINRLTNGVFIVYFVMSLCNTIQGTLLTDLINFYHLQGAMQGMLGTFQSIGSLISLIIAIFMVGRIKKPVVLIIVIIIFMISMAVGATQAAWPVFLLIYLIFGIAKGLDDTTASSMIADLHDGRKAAGKIGFLHGVFGIGGLLAPILIIQLISMGIAWNGVYMVFSIIAVLSLAIYLYTYFKSRKAVEFRFNGRQSITLSDIKSLFSDRRNWLLCISTFSFAVYQIGYYLWISRYVGVNLNNPAMGAVALALFWIGTAVSRIFVPHLKSPAVKIIILGNILAAAVALIGLWSVSIPIILVCSFFAGLTNGATNSMLLYIGCSWLRENTTLVTTVLFFVFYIGQAVCPPAVGAISASAGLAWGISISALFAILSALSMLPLRKEKL